MFLLTGCPQLSARLYWDPDRRDIENASLHQPRHSTPPQPDALPRESREMGEAECFTEIQEAVQAFDARILKLHFLEIKFGIFETGLPPLYTQPSLARVPKSRLGPQNMLP